MTERLIEMLRPEVARLQGYQLPSLSEGALERLIRLDSNENPFGPVPAVREALAAADVWHRYPDPTYAEARRALARYSGAPPDRIVLGNGSDELIDMLVRLFVSPGDRVVIFPPTFDMYEVYTEIAGGQVERVARGQGFAVDLEAAKRAIDRHTKLVFLASPNSPTGNVASANEIETLAAVAPVLVLDEAYAEFAGQNSVPLALERDNVIVLRSLSKWAGLAGLRVGYGVFPAALVPYLNSVRSPYNVNQAAQVAVCATIAEVDLALARVQLIVAERERLAEALPRFSCLRPCPSATNFIFTEVLGVDARELRQELARRGIVVRCYSQPALRDYLRIGVGTPEENDALLAALEEAIAALR